MRDKFEIIKVDPVFKKELQEGIIIERIKRGIDKDKKSIRRVTMAFRRLSDWNTIKEKIINAEFKD